MQHQDYIDRQLKQLSHFLKELLSRMINNGSSQELESAIHSKVKALSIRLDELDLNSISQVELNETLETLIQVRKKSSSEAVKTAAECEIFRIQNYMQSTGKPIRWDLLNDLD